MLKLAAQRIDEAHLIDPEGDSARFYVQEALRLDPQGAAPQEAQRALAVNLLNEAHGAIDRRDFVHASDWLEAAKGIASETDIEAVRGQLANARAQADADAWTQLLRKHGGERLQQQDRLIEPEK